jgi:hypothetical protein
MKSFMLIIAGVLLMSWIITCGILWLICMCFGWGFDLLIATGIWLVLVFLKFIS